MEDINNMDALQSTRGNKSIRKIALVIAVCVLGFIFFMGNTLINQSGSQGKEIHPPEVEFPLSAYTMFKSNVPGFPLTIANKEATRIIVRSSDGDLLLWKSSDGKVISQGKKAEVKPGETIYWSPLTEENKLQYKTIIKLTAYNGRTKLGSTGIEISSENKFIFRGKLITE
ncbi:hypothetical protein [Paenibacillus glycanilyticus]|uniref:hypothetical protein n=1 Tax=Paenibacillus glycanilyticus TaxID=126569 RepID=UPI000FDC20B2|nr:hypothetical protein [Paenibacillus glycanilyticus]